MKGAGVLGRTSALKVERAKSGKDFERRLNGGMCRSEKVNDLKVLELDFDAVESQRGVLNLQVPLKSERMS